MSENNNNTELRMRTLDTGVDGLKRLRLTPESFDCMTRRRVAVFPTAAAAVFRRRLRRG